MNASKSKDSLKNTLLSTLGICLVCAFAITTTSVLLKDKQLENQEFDKKRNIVAVINSKDISKEVVEKEFSHLVPAVVNLYTSKIVSDISISKADTKYQLKTKDGFIMLDSKDDIAGIRKLERYAVIYIKYEKDNVLDKVVLPIRGYGLWSTLYGYIALEKDLNTIAGISFYANGDTPGLGGEVSNPRWSSKWIGKKIYDENGVFKFSLVKGGVSKVNKIAINQVDAIAGSTITSNGVTNLMKFWFSNQGFRNILNKLKTN
jgi:Na+-transporting NADH:ubiquinone oxidoreductase subunit C